jgi:hypothetical protein
LKRVKTNEKYKLDVKAGKARKLPSQILHFQETFFNNILILARIELKRAPGRWPNAGKLVRKSDTVIENVTPLIYEFVV